MNQIFISYSRKDSDFVDGLIRDLEQRGIDVWVDREDIEGGAAWRAAITEAIRECRAFLLVLSPQATHSRNVSRELSLAESRNRLIIPIIHQPCDIPPGMEYQLAELQWIDFTASSREEALKRLVRVLSKEEVASGSSTDSTSVISPPPDEQPVGRPRETLSTQPTGGGLPYETARTSSMPELQHEVAPTGMLPQEKTQSTAVTASAKRSKFTRAVVACVVLLVAGGAYALYRYALQNKTANPVITQPTVLPTPQTALSTPPAGVLDNSPINSGVGQPPSIGAQPSPSSVPATHGSGNVEDRPLTKAQPSPGSVPASRPPRQTESASPIIGNSRTHTYHRPGCPGYRKIHKQYRVEFRSAAEAEKAGYKRADNCP